MFYNKPKITMMLKSIVLIKYFLKPFVSTVFDNLSKFNVF